MYNINYFISDMVTLLCKLRRKYINKSLQIGFFYDKIWWNDEKMVIPPLLLVL